jgi:hypothetical protein
MKKILCALCVSLFVAGAAQATVISTNLDLAASGTYYDSEEATVTTSLSYGTATFDVVYTLGASSTGTNTFITSTGSQLGVGSEVDLTTHYTTLEGEHSEGISFTGLSIVNFVANDSGITTNDITNLTFTSFSLNNTGNSGDYVGVSYTDYASDLASINLKNVGSSTTIELATYGETEDLYLLATSSARWAVTGVDISYEVIPEPATIGMLGLGAIVTFLIRKKQRD